MPRLPATFGRAVPGSVLLLAHLFSGLPGTTAHAQPPPQALGPPASGIQTSGMQVQTGDTMLRLAETVTVMVSPDELAASMRAEALAPNPQEAQRRVNELMRDTLDIARRASGVTISTGGYNVWRVGITPQDRNERWQAGQSVNLTGKDPEAMLRLVGELQQKGLVQGNLVWRLSRDKERAARKDATRQALSGLRGRAEDAAEILGLRFASFREVRLDSVAPPPVIPRQQGVVARASMAAAQQPSTEAEDLPVTASAEADIVLKPR
jgi:predicted secreted protein